MIKIGVIGSEGFVGKNLVMELERITKFTIYCFGKHETSRNNHKNYSQINLSDIEENKKKFQEIDIVYYLVSSSIPASSYNKPITDIQENLIPFLNFLDAMSAVKLKKIIFASSAGTIYGSHKGKIKENADKKPQSPHGIIKFAMENYLLYFLRKSNINHTIFRISNIYGEFQDISKGLGLINTILENHINHKKIKIFGDGSNVRNYIYIKDVVRAMSLVASDKLSSSQIFNLSSNDNLSINEILKIVNTILDRPLEIIFTESRNSDLHRLEIDNTHFINSYQNFYFTNIKKGIKRTFNHLEKRKK
tara:strand:+ start:469 stop:1386 length:918 start_codon:yes stop_codon:yes gene_type:complete